MFKPRQLRCSFCGKNEAEVSKLVAGPRVYICDECVALASHIMGGGTHTDGKPPEAATTFWRRLAARAQRLFRGGGTQRVSSLGVSG